MTEPGPTARDYMSQRLVVFSPDMDVGRAMEVLLEQQISGAPVVDGAGVLVGLLTERDCFAVAVNASYHQHPGGKVADYMTRDVETVPADLDIVAVMERFLRGPYRRFPVVEEGRLVGLISRRDVLRAILELW